MTTIVKAASPQQLLTLAPHMLGYLPHDSLVVVPFVGTRSGMCMRIDLPDATAAGRDIRMLAAEVVRLVVRQHGADAVAFVLYPRHPVGDGALPHGGLATQLIDRARRSRLTIRAVLCHGVDSWGDYAHPEAARGPLAELDLEPAIVLPAGSPWGDRIDAASMRRLASGPGGVPEPAPREQRAWFREQLEALDAIARSGVGAEPAAMIERALGDEPPAGDELAALACMLQLPSMRDVAIVQIAESLAVGRRCVEAQRSWHATEVETDDLRLGVMRIMGEGDTIDPGRIRSGITLIELLVSLTEPQMHPSLLTILGWLHWAIGTASAASACLDEALRIDPEHGMAGLVRQLLDAGRMPSWVVAA